MLTIESHVSLKPYNTFHIDAKARYWVEITGEEDIYTLLQLREFMNTPKLILGAGSNVLLCQDLDGLVINVNIQGIEVIRADDDHTYVKGWSWCELA